MYNIYSIVCTGWSKKAPYFVFHPKVVFYNFFHIFQVVQADSFDTNMEQCT